MLIHFPALAEEMQLLAEQNATRIKLFIPLSRQISVNIETNIVINSKNKKGMKKIVLTMIALLTMMTAVAQQENNNERRAFKKPTPEEMTNRMADQLKLTDKQKKKVLELNKEYEDVIGGPGMGMMGGRHMGPRHNGPRPDGQTGATAQQAQPRERPQLTDEQRKEMQQRMEKRKEYDAKLQKILTDEQQQEYQKMHQRRGGRGGRGGFGGPRPQEQ